MNTPTENLDHANVDWQTLPATFTAFILTHGRPDNVRTYNALKQAGYTGRIILVVDNEDKKREAYKKKFGDEVVVFDKKAISETYPNCDNFTDRRAVVYARNACFEIASSLGITHFIQLDDDYTMFSYRANAKGEFISQKKLLSLNGLFAALVEFMDSTPISAVAIAQGGDYIGGHENSYFKNGWRLLRKIMNSWVCRTDRPFTFCGRMNEDVSAAVLNGSRGHLYFTLTQAQLTQVPTQAAAGGMTEVYMDNGTYLKSFYTVIQHPSSTTVSELWTTNRRFHHNTVWNNAVPRVISEQWRKP